MEKEGKVDILSVLLASVVIFVIYAGLAIGDGPGILTEFPLNGTNASATTGFAAPGFPSMAAFNGTDVLFQVNFTQNESDNVNVTNVTLYLDVVRLTDIDTRVPNLTQYINDTTSNQTINFTLPALAEGLYYWAAMTVDNLSTPTYNSTFNQTFTIDKTPPGLLGNLTNTSNQTGARSGDTVSVAVNFTDALLNIHTVKLYVNVSGQANRTYNTTDVAANGVTPSNVTIVNLSFVVPGEAIGHVLNVTLQANDSAGNINITSAILEVVNDGTPPGPINLSNPISLFNTSDPSALEFNFSAVDNNDTDFECVVNVSLTDEEFTSIKGLNVTSGVHHLNTTSIGFTNGTYDWNASCTDGNGRKNVSVIRQFTVDTIAPFFDYINFTNTSTINDSGSENGTLARPLGIADNDTSETRAQGDAATGLIHVNANWTDNLTIVVQGLLQFYNGSSDSWVTANESVRDNTSYEAADNDNWINLSFLVPKGHNMFEGKNVSFRLSANDSVGNRNITTIRNYTIGINDTTVPEITINGTVAVNGSNLSTTSILVGWSVNDRSDINEINISIDGVVTDDGCNKFKRFTTNSEPNRNSSFSVSTDPLCELGNGTHFIEVRSRDSFGNVEISFHNFTIQTASQPALNLTNLSVQYVSWIKGRHNGSFNGSNITHRVGLGLYGTNGVGASIANLTFVSSCDTTTEVVFENDTIIYPFNETYCPTTQSQNRTVKVTVTDTAGNSNSTTFGFLVDNVGPTIAVTKPTPGEDFKNVDTNISLHVSDNDQRVAFVGYFLDGEFTDNFTINISASGNLFNGTINGSIVTTINQTGTHTIKFTANDSLGNVGNTTEITFTQRGPIPVLITNATIRDINVNNFTNVSIFNSTGFLQEVADIDGDQTLELLLGLNRTVKGGNVSINFNGSAANWNQTTKIRAWLNDSVSYGHIKNNYTSSLNNTVYVNGSIDKFLSDNNSYYAIITLSLNVSNESFFGTNNIWFFPDELDLTNRVNVTQCSSGFSPTHSTATSSTFPCWNNTDNTSVDVLVPHLSIVAVADNNLAPNITVHTPDSANQTVSSFVTNISVSGDAITCTVSLNGTGPTVTMTKSGNTCLGQTETLKNLVAETGNYNFTFNVTDEAGNTNTLVYHFNVTDSTRPNLSNSSDHVTVAGTASDSLTVEISGINESVNASLYFATTVDGISQTGTLVDQNDFNATQSLTLSSLDAETTYYFNITVCDANGNCVTNGTFQGTTDAASSTSTSTSTTTSGGGGGGAAAVSTVSDSKAQVWSTVPGGSSISLDVNKETIAVTSVAVNDVKSELSNVELEVAALTKNPVSAEPTSKVYQYLRITKKNLKNEDAGSFKVSFRVPKSWITENNLDSGDVALFRFGDGWNQLPTRVTGSDATYVNYEADTPGFSSFAVGVRAEAVVEGEGPVEEEEEVPQVPEEEAEPIPVERPKPVEAPSKAPIAWIIAAIVIILGIILIMVYQKKKQG